MRCYENSIAEKLFTFKKKLPFLGFFQIPQNSNRFYNTPARVTFFVGPLKLGAKTCCQNLLEFGKRVVFSNVNNFSAVLLS
jgi:hypothetical protein